MTLVSGDTTSGEMTFGRLDRNSVKVLLERFHLNGNTMGFRPEI